VANCRGNSEFSPRLCETIIVSVQLPTLIFDLDGTLTDSKPGIVACLRKVLEAHGLAIDGPLERFVGPPVEEWVAELMPGGTQQARAELAQDYRACYSREGWNKNSVYPGVQEMLAELDSEGFPLYVCTSKHHPFAVRILDLFELSGFFKAVYGDKAEYLSHSKADLLAGLIRDCSLQAATSWMIGDRSYDIQAARANGVGSIAAAWGYGSQEEWAQADAIAMAPDQVRSLAMATTKSSPA
jgi:phosphoglycolate phosphatase